MIEQNTPARGPVRARSPRNMILTFAADRDVRTPDGPLPAAQLRPGDRVLSGDTGGFVVLSMALCAGSAAQGGQSLVKVVVSRKVADTRVAERLVVGAVSPKDGRLHLDTGRMVAQAVH